MRTANGLGIDDVDLDKELLFSSTGWQQENRYEVVDFSI